MPRRNQKRGVRQHSKNRNRPREWHRKASSPGIRQAAEWLRRAA